MSLYYNNFYPYGPYQHDDEDYGFYPQYDARIFPGIGGGTGGGFPGPGPFPGQGGGFPGGPGGPGGGGAPTTAPPPYTPQEQVTAFAVDPGGIRRCMYRFTYIWLNNGSSFWFYPVFVGRNSVAGWRWSRRRGWVYYGIDLRQIRSFQC